jgi:hypothetical protein
VFSSLLSCDQVSPVACSILLFNVASSAQILETFLIACPQSFNFSLSIAIAVACPALTIFSKSCQSKPVLTLILLAKILSVSQSFMQKC